MDRTYELRDALPTMIVSAILALWMILTAFAAGEGDIEALIVCGIVAVTAVIAFIGGINMIMVFDSKGFRHLLTKKGCTWEEINDVEMCAERVRTSRRVGKKNVQYLAVYTDEIHIKPSIMKFKNVSAFIISGAFSVQTFERYLNGYRRDLYIRYPYEH